MTITALNLLSFCETNPQILYRMKSRQRNPISTYVRYKVLSNLVEYPSQYTVDSNLLNVYVYPTDEFDDYIDEPSARLPQPVAVLTVCPKLRRLFEYLNGIYVLATSDDLIPQLNLISTQHGH